MNTDNHQRPNAAQLVHQHHEDEHHLMDYVRVLYKRRWIAIPAFLIVFLVGAMNSFRTTPIYEARTQLLIEKDSPKVGRLDTMFQESDGWYNDDFYQTQYRILQSRTLARHTAELMDLPNHPSLKKAMEPTTGPITLTGLFYDGLGWVEGLFRGAPAETPAPAPPPQEPQDKYGPYAGIILGSLTVSPVRNSRLVELRFSSTDPKLAADMANAHAKAYIQQSLEMRFSASKEASDWLGGQLAEQRKKVEESEAALQRYKESHDAVAVEDRQNIVVQRLADLNSAATKAKTGRIEREAQYNQLKTLQGTPAVDAFPAVVANEYIQKLKSEIGDLQRQQAQLAEKYGERHPEMMKVRSAIASTQAKYDMEVGKVIQSVKAEYEAALAQERSLVGALEGQKTEALGLNRKGIEYSVLSREAESNRQVYEALLQRTKETGISGELKTSNIRVVDTAELPDYPVLPRRQRDLMMAMISGTILALGLVFLFEYLDNRIKSPQELRQYLNLPFLGMVPAIDTSGPTLLHHGVPPAFGEAIRAVRTNVLFSSAEEGVRMIVVTSAGPGEGKSMFSSNLSVSLAQAGQRVLHIDADMRRPRVHEIFEVAQEPGLSNLLVGDCKPSEAVRKTSVQNLAILPAGMIPPNPAELLGSKRCLEYFSTLSEHFDWVVIDSPPVLAVADASVIANAATGVVFVVGADQTSRQTARAAVEQLHSVGAHIIGAVLNRADVERNPVLLLRVLPQGVPAATTRRRRRPARSPNPATAPVLGAPMRVLFLTPAAGFGGAERALVQSLKAVRHCEPTWTLGLLALEDGPALDAARNLGVDVMVAPPPGRFLETGESGRSSSGTLGGLLAAAPALGRYAAALRRRVAAWRPVIIHSNGIKTHVLGAWVRGRAPLVWHVHDYLSLRSLSPAS